MRIYLFHILNIGDDSEKKIFKNKKQKLIVRLEANKFIQENISSNYV